MGAGQSSGKSGASEAENAKTSYYELLGVARQATDDEIKKAYRRKALELHPDRNYGREEEATQLFADIQAAYEVLSDSQERAWYDSHESAILRGEDGGGPGDDAPYAYENVKITTADDLARLLRKFNSNVEFSDAPSGFYGFLRETFEQLAKEEEAAAMWEGGATVVPEYPPFGHEDDTYDDVVKTFYSAWGSFSTIKSFSWKDKYRLSEAPDRWYRRRMEQENKAIRNDAKKEFNDAVRAFIAFVRKRDPRFVPSTQSEEERQKILRDAAASQAARARAQNAAKIAAEAEAVPSWATYREPDELEEEEEEETVQEILECVACNKVFKSERQFEAHERSKKHQKAVAHLKKQMRKDDIRLDLEGDESGSVTPMDIESDFEGAATGDAQEEQQSSNGLEPKDALDTDEVTATSDDSHISLRSASPAPTYDQRDEPEDVKVTPAGTPESDDDSDYAPRSQVAERLASTTISDPSLQQTESSGPEENGTQQAPVKKLGAAAAKRAKRAERAAAAATGGEADEDEGESCAVCNRSFASRTKLFAHIRAEGHVGLKSEVNGGSKKGGGAGGKKKGKAKK